jgi:2,5-dichloro-2,5-cyclohexadiene-1,4-diol dehydrogenase 1
MKCLEDKSIIVTGAASGIGRAAAMLFAANGARVMAADINEVGGLETVNGVAAAGGQALFKRADISREADVRALVDATVGAFGRLDGAFNNAGIVNLCKDLHEITLEEFERCQVINLTGTFLCMKYEIDAMLETGGGAIVNTASAAGLVGFSRSSEYAASKGGIIALTRAAALDYGTRGIRVNSIAPGAVLTPMVQKNIDDNPGVEEFLKTAHPIGRFSQPIEQGQAAMWLLSDLSSFVTGVCLPVDGGFTSV